MGSRLTTEEFIERAVEIHGNKYDYSKVVYTKAINKVTIVCPEHGEFEQTPNVHINSSAGCIRCHGENTSKRCSLPHSEYMQRVVDKYADTYGYDRLSYKNAKTKIEVYCKVHGEYFFVKPFHFLDGHACVKCSRDRISKDLLMSQEDYIKKVTTVHNGKYSYERCVYTGSNSKVSVSCPVHGEFKVIARQHSSGVGCSACSKTGFNQKKLGVVYILAHDNIIKLGISNKSGSYRTVNINRTSGLLFSVTHEVILDGADCLKIETIMHKWLKSMYKSPQFRFDGYTECFIDAPVTDVVNRLHEEVDKLYS